MGLIPFEKVALDSLDRRTLEQFRAFGKKLGRSFSGKALHGLGHGLTAGGRFLGRGMEAVGDYIVHHPTRSMLYGAPVAVGLCRFPGDLDRSMNNVQPENLYQYRQPFSL